MEYKKVLVTGGAGFIGSHVVEKLEHEGLEVVVADDLSTGTLGNLRNGTPFELIDVSNEAQVKGLFKKYNREISHVVHLAAYINLQGSMKAPQIDAYKNVMGILNMVVSSRDSGVKKFVFSSSTAVYGMPKNPDLPIDESHPLYPKSPYGITKGAGENYLRVLSKDKMGWTILRFSNTYGERQKLDKDGEGGVIPTFLDSLENNLPVELRHNGRATRDYIYVSDIANGVYLGLTTPNGAYNLGTKRGTEVEVLWDTLKSYFGKNGADAPEARYTYLKPGEVAKLIV